MTTTRHEDRLFGKGDFAPRRPGLKSTRSWLHRQLRRRKQCVSPFRRVLRSHPAASLRRGGNQGGVRRPGGAETCLSGRGCPLCHRNIRGSGHPADEALPALGLSADSQTNRAELAWPDHLAWSRELQTLRDLAMRRAEHQRRSVRLSNAGVRPAERSPDAAVFAARSSGNLAKE